MASDTRERLLSAVETVLSADGVAGLSLRKVARHAGMSHAAPGVLFGDKAGLLTAYAARGFDDLAGRMAAALHDQDSGPVSLARVGQAYVDFAFDRPAAFEIMFRQDLLHARDPGYLASTEKAFAPLAGSLAKCVREGRVEKSAVGDTLLTAWTLVHGLVMLWQSKHLVGKVDSSDPRVLGRRVTELFAGLLATAGARS